MQRPQCDSVAVGEAQIGHRTPSAPGNEVRHAIQSPESPAGRQQRKQAGDIMERIHALRLLELSKRLADKRKNVPDTRKCANFGTYNLT